LVIKKKNDLVRAPRGIQTTALIGAFWKADTTGARFLNLEQPIMKAIKTYSTRLDADLAKIALDAAGVPAVVVGVGLAMEGGAAGVQLLVPRNASMRR
jgi:hypothetical protein